jgi:hypothetical protein
MILSTRANPTPLPAVLLVALLVSLPERSAEAGIHTWDVNEVFSNADGTIQFVELWEANGTPGETGVGNGTLSSDTQSFSIGAGAVAPPTTNKYYLIATPAFAALPGAPTPDALIPEGSMVFFDVSGDTVSFGSFDSWTFGPVPTNGSDSLDRFTGPGANTPTNYAGESGSVDAAPAPVPLPMVSFRALLILAAAILALGAFAITRRNRAREWRDVA